MEIIEPNQKDVLVIGREFCYYNNGIRMNHTSEYYLKLIMLKLFQEDFDEVTLLFGQKYLYVIIDLIGLEDKKGLLSGITTCKKMDSVKTYTKLREEIPKQRCILRKIDALT